MSLKEQAFRVAVLGALKDAIATQYADQRGGLLDELLDAQDTLGVKSLDVSLPDGTKVATVTLTQPSVRFEVVDEDAFTKWVAENYPTEVETVTTVRPAFRKAFFGQLAVVTAEGFVTAAVDPRTGELIPSIRVHPPSRPSSFSVRYTPEGRPAIAKAWSRGELAVGIGYAPLEVEGGA